MPTGRDRPTADRVAIYVRLCERRCPPSVGWIRRTFVERRCDRGHDSRPRRARRDPFVHSMDVDIPLLVRAAAQMISCGLRAAGSGCLSPEHEVRRHHLGNNGGRRALLDAERIVGSLTATYPNWEQMPDPHHAELGSVSTGLLITPTNLPRIGSTPIRTCSGPFAPPEGTAGPAAGTAVPRSR